MKRLLSYLKPHKWVMLTAAILVLLIIVVELYRPVIIGDAIDRYINGSYVQMMEEGTLTLTLEELTVLRNESFAGILRAAGLYLIMLLSGFVLNACNNWILQKMGQKIIYQMREEVFGHIHSLSLGFFNTTPVGKLVTRVSNDTEAVNELFTTILVKLFKNSVKIAGYAVVMVWFDAHGVGVLCTFACGDSVDLFLPVYVTEGISDHKK